MTVTRSARLTRAGAAGVIATSLLALSACGDQTSSTQQPTASSPTTSANLTTQPEDSESQTSSEQNETGSSTQAPTTQTTGAAAPDSPTSSTSTSSENSPSTSTSTPPLTDDGKPLTVGSRSPRVLAAQQKMVALGYFVPGAQGTFGGATRQAVYAVQKAAGLRRTGSIDAATQAAIDRGVKPTSRTGGSGIEIDVPRQLVLVVSGGKVIRTFNASSGNGETFEAPVLDPKTEKPTGKTEKYTAATPRGAYRITFQRDELWESKLELGTLYRPKYFNGGIAVHGAGSVPPVPASHGCVRISNAAMDWVWNSGYAPVGARVTVY